MKVVARALVGLSLIGLSPVYAVNPAPLVHPPAIGADPQIEAMVARVSSDSIYRFLERLTGEASVDLGYGPRFIRTRYSLMEEAEKASEYLVNQFIVGGYSVNLHHFAFPYDLLGVVSAQDGASITVGGVGRILRALDPQEWHRVKAGVDTSEVGLLAIASADNGCFTAVGNEGIILSTTDNGSSWALVESGALANLRSIDINDDGYGWAVGDSGAVLATVDGGRTWTPQFSGTTLHLRDVFVLTSSTGIAVGDFGLILRTTNGGVTWSEIDSGTSRHLRAITLVGQDGWAVGYLGTIRKSTDGGLTWAPQTSGSYQFFKDVAFQDPQVGWVVGSTGPILFTSNGGATWSTQDPPDGVGNLNSLAVVSPTEVWAVGHDGNILRTTDGGIHWHSRNETIRAGWANVEATKLGTTSADEEVLLIAHYDSMSENPTELAPGADDNGSGTSVVVEAAKVMAANSFNRTIRFVCFSGEEQGLLGSEVYARKAADSGRQIVGVFNLDGVGCNDDLFRIFSDEDSQWLGETAYEAAITYVPDLSVSHELWDGGNSDHQSFRRYGFDAIFGQEDSPHPPQWHTTGDTLGLLRISFIADVTRMSVGTIASVAGIDTGAIAVDQNIHAGGDAALDLSAPFPNPFAASTAIGFRLPNGANVDVSVFDTHGRRVATLANGPHTAGRHEVLWSGQTDAGLPVSAGVYFLRLGAGPASRSRRVLVVR